MIQQHYINCGILGSEVLVNIHYDFNQFEAADRDQPGENGGLIILAVTGAEGQLDGIDLMPMMSQDDLDELEREIEGEV